MGHDDCERIRKKLYRDNFHRFEVMQIENLNDQSVLDLGCQVGDIAIESYLRGAIKILGIDSESEYIKCARKLAKHSDYDIKFIRADMREESEVPRIVNDYFGDTPIDVVFALGLYKQSKGFMFEILSEIKFKTLYIEAHNAGKLGMQSPHVEEILSYMKEYNFSHTLLGFTEDRNIRPVWRVVNE